MKWRMTGATSQSKSLFGERWGKKTGERGRKEGGEKAQRTSPREKLLEKVRGGEGGNAQPI